MGIFVHRAHRADVLADGLAELLATPPTDPFDSDVVAVPTRGVERFLSQRLALHLGARPGSQDGVCANVEFPSPTELFAGLSDNLLDASPEAPTSDDQPRFYRSLRSWQLQPLTWAVARILPDLADRRDCPALSKRLNGSFGAQSAGRLLATADRAARLLTQYQDERPQMLASWDLGTCEIPRDCHWQYLLWHELVRQLGPGPALLLPDLVARLADHPELSGLPSRLSFFGPTRLSVTSLELLGALGLNREVHLWLVDPSPAGWGAKPQHPLLYSQGRDFLGLATRLRALKHTDDCRPTPPTPASVLGYLQADIAANRTPQIRDIGPTDDSLQIHACHGTTRQVEVAREVILGLLGADPTLQPRDILVMCPDLDTFAPLFSATFAATPTDPAIADLRLRIADRTPEQANEVLAALAHALDLLTGRVTIGAVLDLVAAPAVARRFQIDDTGLARLRELAQAAGVYWGLDAATRARYGLSGIDTGTWTFGLDRVLLGVALGEDELATFGGVLPLDDVGSSDLELVGALATLLSVLGATQSYLSGMHPLTGWVQMLTDLARSLAAPPREADWMAAHAEAVLRAPLRADLDSLGLNSLSPESPGPESPEVEASSAQAHMRQTSGDLEPESHDQEQGGRLTNLDGPLLAFGDISYLLAQAFAGRPTRANFRTGGLTVAGLVPMRSVPHRVIVLVGLDDGAFPRNEASDGDNLLVRDPRAGERNARTEDRQLFLDAIMAAQEHLIITYCGADDRTNEERPPAVPVSELLDVMSRMVDGAQGQPNHQRFVTKHPLQPFDPRNFVSGALVTGRPFSHDRAALAGAIAASGKRQVPEPFLPAPLPEPGRPDEVTIAELAAFLADPLAYFLRSRLGLPTRAHEEPPPERLPVHLSGLAEWEVGERLLDGMRHGHKPHTLIEVERLRGALPPGELGAAAIQEIGPKAGGIFDQFLDHIRGPMNMIRVNLHLPKGIRLTGSVPEIVMPINAPGTDPAGNQALVVRTTYSKFKPSRFLGLWVALLAAQLSRPDLHFSALLVAQDKTRALAAPNPLLCEEHLTLLCHLLAAGLCEPLPMPPRPAHEYARTRHRGGSPESATEAAERCWSAKFGDCTEPAAIRLFGPNAPFAVLTGSPPHAHEAVSGEDNRFAALSRLVWDPVLTAVVEGRSLLSKVAS